jgi:hypothetical protein
MNENIDVQRLWVSRVSFGLAAVALTALVHGGCQRLSEEEATGTTTAIEPAALKSTPQEPKPGILQPTEAPAKVTEAVKPEATPKVTPKETDEAKPAPDPKELEGTLTVTRLTVTTEVKDREPVEASTFVAGTESIVAFVEMSNAADVDQKIVVTFESTDAKKVGFIELTVPKNQTRWRTWGQTRNIKRSGDWTAVVSTEAGVELSRTDFQVSDPSLPSG